MAIADWRINRNRCLESIYRISDPSMKEVITGPWKSTDQKHKNVSLNYYKCEEKDEE